MNEQVTRPPKVVVSFMLKPEVLAELRDAAHKENRSLSNLVETILKRHFKRLTERMG